MINSSGKKSIEIQLLTVPELADLMHVSSGHIRNLISSKKIAYRKIPGFGIRFLATDVLAMIERGRVEIHPTV